MKGTQPRKVLTDGASGTIGDRMTGVSGSGGVLGDPAGSSVSNANAIIVNDMPVPAGGTSFARPAGRKTGSFATRVTKHQIQMAGDPIGRLRGDETSVAQARIVVGAGGVTLQGIEGTNVQSGYYRTLNDSKVYDGHDGHGQMTSCTDKMVKRPLMTLLLFLSSCKVIVQLWWLIFL